MVLCETRLRGVSMGREDPIYCQQVGLFQVGSLFRELKVDRYRGTFESDKLPGENLKI